MRASSDGPAAVWYVWMVWTTWFISLSAASAKLTDGGVPRTDSAGAVLCEAPAADESAEAAATARAEASPEALDALAVVVVVAEAAGPAGASGWDVDPEPPNPPAIVPADADRPIGATPTPPPDAEPAPVELVAYVMAANAGPARRMTFGTTRAESAPGVDPGSGVEAAAAAACWVVSAGAWAGTTEVGRAVGLGATVESVGGILPCDNADSALCRGVVGVAWAAGNAVAPDCAVDETAGDSAGLEDPSDGIHPAVAAVLGTAACEASTTDAAAWLAPGGVAVGAAAAEDFTNTGTAADAQLLGTCELSPENPPDDASCATAPGASAAPGTSAARVAPGMPNVAGKLVTVVTGPASGASGREGRAG